MSKIIKRNPFEQSMCTLKNERQDSKIGSVQEVGNSWTWESK
jgi:hypothetical protein